MRKRMRARMGFILLSAMTCLLWGGGSQAQDYPKSPVQVIIPFGPGGLTDIFWRSVSDFIGSNLKGTIVLVNKPGGGGVVGTSFASVSKPDGYTLVSANSDPLTISPVFTPNVTYNPDKDFTYIAKLAAFASTISVRADSPFKTLEDLVAFAKTNPGKLKSAVMGVGSVPHTIHRVFNEEAKVEINFVPFDSGGESITNLLGGHTDLTVISVSAINSQVQAGKARILGMCSPKRIPAFPEIPTLAEKGYKKSSIATGVGLAGPKGMSPAIVSKWEEAIDKTLKDPKVIGIIEKLGGAIVDFKSGEEYKKELMADLATFKQIVPKLGEKK
jgi:tripartite-type tricarboxylate transporter receptor subunit TctC